MVSHPEVPNGPFPRPDPLSLAPEFISPFPLPGSISPLHLVDADMRTDQRLPPVRIEKPEAPGKKTQSSAEDPHVILETPWFSLKKTQLL